MSELARYAVTDLMGRDLRRWERFDVEVPVRVTLPSSLGSKVHDGTGTSVSQGGMAVFIPAEVGLVGGQVVQLDVTLPYSSLKISLKAIVRNRHGFRYGLEFLNLTTIERDLIERICRALSLLNDSTPQ